MEAFGVVIIEQEREKEKGQAISTTRTLLGRLEHAAEVVAAGRRRSNLFFPTLSFFSGVFPGDLCFDIERSTSSWFREHLKIYVERCGYQQMKNNLCSKIPTRTNLRIFLHKPIAVLYC